jgi:Fibronectin type III domain/Right handed beta helix region
MHDYNRSNHLEICSPSAATGLYYTPFPTSRFAAAALGLILLAASTADAASIALQWDPPTDGVTTGYVISYGPAPGVYSNRVVLGVTTRYEIIGLTDGLRYCFMVQASSAAGLKSPASAQVCGTAGVAPTTGKLVKTAVELQAALAAARPGDTILLQAGVTFVGNFVLPRVVEGATAYITIRSSAANSVLPSAGVRMTPAYAAQLPKLRSPNSSPAISAAPGAHHYKLQFLEIMANAAGAGDMIALGDGSSAQRSLEDVPYELVLDRLLLRGDRVFGQRRGIALNSASTSIINSHLSEMKAAKVSAQAIAGWNGPGPFVITNNYLEASGENVQFGGSPPSIPLLGPSRITMRRNHITKQLLWKGQPWLIDSLLEFKNGIDVVVDGNLLENCWSGKNLGFAVQLYSANTIVDPPWSEIRNLSFTNNIVRNVSAGMYVAGDTVSDISIRNNLFEIDKISGSFPGEGMFMAIIGGAEITIDHNTINSEGYYGLLAGSTATRLAFTNNVIVDRGGAIVGAGASPGNQTIARFFPDGHFAGGIYAGADKKQYPVNNFYPSSVWAVGFVNYTRGDYRLSSESVYRKGATDGTDPGCDFPALLLAQWR